VVTESDIGHHLEQAKEIIRQLAAVLDECHKLLAESSAASRQSKQDDHPPRDS
jgi:hypothetical protein